MRLPSLQSFWSWAERWTITDIYSQSLLQTSENKLPSNMCGWCLQTVDRRTFRTWGTNLQYYQFQLKKYSFGTSVNKARESEGDNKPKCVFYYGVYTWLSPKVINLRLLSKLWFCIYLCHTIILFFLMQMYFIEYITVIQRTCTVTVIFEFVTQSVMSQC